ncbi:hypothetical protein ACTNDZ_13460 [Selenomonas montiformis]|uniref:hypothetical protein n=1 Tax=Selenomonas montiformis TaxID=2652285 RepID=UPI003F8BC052
MKKCFNKNNPNDIYYVFDDGFYKHTELFRKITDEEKERVEREYSWFLREEFHWRTDEVEYISDRDRDPWEGIANYVHKYGLNQTIKHGKLNADEAEKYIKEAGGLEREDLKTIWVTFLKRLRYWKFMAFIGD